MMSDEALIGERRRLVSLAFRMLGTFAEAEDAVQETYARWYRMSADERAAVEVPPAWLTTVASRVCLDMLGSARVRHERYVGPWLPEPVPLSPESADDPLARVALDESVSTALLVVLETLTPAERVAFVLHDVFRMPFGEVGAVLARSPGASRQLATSARRKVVGVRRTAVSRRHHDEVVRGFASAVRSGDLNALVAALDPAVELHSDGGGVVSAARHPVVGADRVARFLLGVVRKAASTEVSEHETHDGLGFVLWRDGRVVGVTTVEVSGERVSAVRIVMNPHKLTRWGGVGAP